jgi:hypothetical protein
VPALAESPTTKPMNALQQTGTLLLTLKRPQRQKNTRNRNKKYTQTWEEKELSKHVRPVKL